MIHGPLPTLAVFGSAVAVGVLLAVHDNDAAFAITAGGVPLMMVAVIRTLGSGRR